MTLKIGKFEVGGRLLAPLAGYTDIAFRELCKGYGAGLTVTEMVSVRGLVRDNANTEILTRISNAKVRRACSFSETIPTSSRAPRKCSTAI